MGNKIDSQLSKKFSGLEVGYKFPPVTYELTPSIISKFEKAVESRSSVNNFVSPLALLAYAMKATFQFIDVPPGTIHTSQDVESFKPVTAGSRVSYHARVIQKVSRSKMSITAIELNAFDQDKEKVLSATTTLITPC